MFTGIIEETGTLRQIVKGEKSSVLAIEAEKVLEGTQIGDSIAVNGICLTVTSLTDDSFSADVMAETMRRTNLGSQCVGSKVNLERALTPLTRMGGHIVSGHIDGIGKITSYVREDNAVWVTVETEKSLLKTAPPTYPPLLYIISARAEKSPPDVESNTTSRFLCSAA